MSPEQQRPGTLPGKERPIRVGFMYMDMVGEQWTAGRHYLLNLFQALRSLDSELRPQIVLLVANQATYEELGNLLPLSDEVLHLPPPRQSYWRRSRTWIKNQLGMEHDVSIFLRQQGIAALFAPREFGPQFRVPLLAWVPDFQHLYLPEMFTVQEIGSRNAAFHRMGIAASCIVASSETVKNDWKSFALEVAFKARVLSFVAQIPSDVYVRDCRAVCAKYHLPERFIFLPNQFWKHKNHMLVVESLALAKTTCPDLMIVCTGNTNEYRDRAYFGNLLAKISESGVRDNLILLGVVPHADMFQLIRQSVAVLQPSLFEGWSTTVEEVKSTGKRIILSDIPVHREQNPPAADYFDPYGPETLSSLLIHAYSTFEPGPSLELETRARDELPIRTRQFAKTFQVIAEEAANL